MCMSAVVLNTWGKGFPQVMHTPTPLWITGQTCG
jgi:hypothetical protein